MAMTPDEVERSLTRIYGGRTKQVYEALAPAGEAEVVYSAPVLTNPAAFVVLEASASRPYIAGRQGGSVTIGRETTDAAETIRMLIFLPDQRVD